MSNPITEVHFLYVPLDNTNKNQIKFSSKTEQENYFARHIVKQFEDMVYQRYNTKMRVDAKLDDMLNVNYLMYTNDGERWIYCYITEMQFINNSVTEITLETDVYQTWLFDITFLESFVVREHVSDDSIGSNLVDEGLDTGEYIVAGSTSYLQMEELWIVAAYTPGTGVSTDAFGGMYGGVYSGLMFMAIDPATDITALNNFIMNLESNPSQGTIHFIFMIPRVFLPENTQSRAAIPYNQNSREGQFNFDVYMNDFGGYVPKNKKLYQYPYNYLYLTNNKGANATYRFEDFDDPTHPSFSVRGNVAPSPVALCYPNNYKNRLSNFEYGITMDGFPLCAWKSDTYSKWLAQNANSIILNTMTGLGAIGAGVLTGNGIVVGGGVMEVLNQLNSLEVHSMSPDQAKGNTNSGSLNCAFYNAIFSAYQMHIKKEYAIRIDKFFDLYGYKVNTVKVPNMSNRPYWNYIKTIDINIKGDIPQRDMNKLKSLFDNGITLWHDGDNIGNYSLNNH